MAIDGRTLRVERRLADISQVELAGRMRLSRQSVWVIERSADVDPERAREYREALEAARTAKMASSGEGGR